MSSDSRKDDFKARMVEAKIPDLQKECLVPDPTRTGKLYPLADAPFDGGWRCTICARSGWPASAGNDHECDPSDERKVLAKDLERAESVAARMRQRMVDLEGELSERD